MVECREEIKQTITETNETVIQVREELISKISDVEDEGKNRIDELQQVTTAECTRTKQEVLKKLEEKQKEIQTDVSERVEGVYSNLNQVCLLYTSKHINHDTKNVKFGK